ncbi:hypothetical protein GIB67_000098, partial [Kingdonia uniflora]
MAQLRQGIEKVSDFFMHMLHLARGDITQLVEFRSYNWVGAITGWMSNCPGVGVGDSLRVPSFEIPGEEDQLASLEPQESLEEDSNLVPFEILRRVILWRTHTLGWHNLKVNGEVQARKGLRWIPRHPEMRKGV